MSSQVGHQGKVLPPEGVRHRKRLPGVGTAPNLSSQSTWTVLSAGLVFSNPAGSRESHLVILVGPFQLEILYDLVYK